MNTISQAYLCGCLANAQGLPYDEEESADWQAGWDDRQVEREEWLALCAECDPCVLE